MTPTVDLKADWRLLAVAGVLLAGYVYVLKKAAAAAGDLAHDVAAALDPTSPDNLAASSVAAVGEAVTGEEGWTPGGALYDWTHDDETNEPNAAGVLFDWMAGV